MERISVDQDGVCLIIEVLLLKDTGRDEAGGQCKMEDGPVFKCHLLALLPLASQFSSLVLDNYPLSLKW